MALYTYYVYILGCSDHTYYTGVTNNLERRFNEHAQGFENSCYTFQRRPLKLLYSEYFYDINQAIAREKQIKGWSRKKKEALMAGNIKEIEAAAVCVNVTSHKYNNHE